MARRAVAPAVQRPVAVGDEEVARVVFVSFNAEAVGTDDPGVVGPGRGPVADAAHEPGEVRGGGLQQQVHAFLPVGPDHGFQVGVGADGQPHPEAVNIAQAQGLRAFLDAVLHIVLVQASLSVPGDDLSLGTQQYQ